MTGTIQVSFEAKSKDELPLLEFGKQVGITLGKHKLLATVTKATLRDVKQARVFNKDMPYEVQYTLDVDE